MLLHKIDDKNYVEKEVNEKDGFENYYKFYVNGSFIGGMRNKHFLCNRKGKLQDVEIDVQAIRLLESYCQ